MAWRTLLMFQADMCDMMVDVSVSVAASWFCKNLVLWIIKLYALTQIE